MNGIKVDQNMLLRNLCPGFIVLAFLFWRYSEFFLELPKSIPTMVAVLIFGFIFYVIYRTLFFDLILRPIETHMLKIVPQYHGFHFAVIDELIKDKTLPSELINKIKKKGKDFRLVMNILAVLLDNDKTNFRNQITIHNSTVHLLFMSSLLSLLFLLHDLFMLQNITFLFPVLFVLLMICGFLLDNWANHREELFLLDNKADYVVRFLGKMKHR